jgi:hypothetical protein
MDALKKGASVDGAGCPAFDHKTVDDIRYQWSHTEGGPAVNFLAGWTTSAIVISIDVDVVNKGGKFLAVWGTAATPERQVNRVGRPLMKNSLLGLFEPDEIGDNLKEAYDSATPATSARFIPEIQRALALYDALDGNCGNQLLANHAQAQAQRYQALATLLADDRLWVNSASKVCTQLFAVELAYAAGQTAFENDCGGRTPNYKAANIYRSLLVKGTTVGIDDGLDHDEREHSSTVFPFLAIPDAGSAAIDKTYKGQD